jgi:Flp pilus assembly protein TadG
LKSNPALVSCERGTSAVELALCLAVFLGLIFGVINIARVLWIVGSLHFAAESAARCASANTTTCGSASAIQSYALNQYHGESLGGTNPFTYFPATGCGNTVSASYTYSLSIPFFGTYSLPLAATACFP